VKSLTVIEAFDIFEDGQVDVRIIAPVVSVQQLDFECAKERFHGGVIITIAFGAHAANDTMALEQGAIESAGVLNAAIRVMNTTLDRSALF